MINLRMQTQSNRLKPKITVVGVGGAGGNAVNNMIQSNLEGCEFLVCNTDAQAIEGNQAHHKIQLGANVTRGLGAGANPEVGRAAADESIEEILAVLDGSNMVFVTAGMGGGTGTGAAPVIAQAAREAGILTIGVVTKPFHFEGTHRMKLAEAGIAELQKHVDTLIIIPNQNLFRIANEKTTFADAFRMADEVLQSGVRGVTDLMVMPGLINLDFADVRAVMAEMGKAMMGTGEAMGERRAVEAAEAAISNPLLDDVSMKGARGVLVNIMGGLDMTLFEVDEAMNRIREEVDPDANIIFGSTFDQTLQGQMRVSVVATGIEAAESQRAPHLSGAYGQQSFAQQSYNQQGYGQQQRVQTRPASTAARGTTSAYNAQPAGGYVAQPAAHVAAAVAGGIPASIVPTMNARSQQPMAQQAAPVAPEAEWNEQPQTGYAQGAAPVASAAATARKIEDVETEIDPWADAPAQAQSYQRPAPVQRDARMTGVSAQPRATRQGDNFIPPRPVDPRGQAAVQTPVGGDLFGAQAVEDVVEAAAPKAKKSPSLFERFTLGRKEEPVAAAPVAQPVVKSETHGHLTVETNTAMTEEDELDIPAFLRRQAN